MVSFAGVGVNAAKIPLPDKSAKIDNRVLPSPRSRERAACLDELTG